MGRMGEADITEDALLGGLIRVRQPAKGYRVNVDTLLLARSLPPADVPSGPIVEVGCGVGAVVLAIAKSVVERGVRCVGIERDALYARLARENVELNGLSNVEIIEADALDPPADLGQFYRVFFNPPYDEPGSARPPADARRAAFVAERPIADWIKVWSNRMTAHSSMTLIHRAHRLGDILAALEGRLGGVEVFPIRSCAHAKAQRVIVRAWKGSRAPLKLFKGLDLHPDDGATDKYTTEAEAILRGQAHICFG